MRKKSKSRQRGQQQTPVKSGKRKELLNYLMVFISGAVIAGGAVMLIATGGNEGKSLRLDTSPNSSPGIAGHRTVAQLIALSDDDLEQVDIVEMSVAVAWEIPGLEKLDYSHYKKIVDGWTDEFSRWLPTVEHVFRTEPGRYKNDINFFRLGMLAQFLDNSVGMAYNEQQKRIMLQERKTGKKVGIRYTDPGDLLLHGLIDTKRGTCATMPVLHVAIARRMG